MKIKSKTNRLPVLLTISQDSNKELITNTLVFKASVFSYKSYKIYKKIFFDNNNN